MAKEEKKTIIFSGIRPTGALHIGNYFGALLPLVELQKKADKLFIMVANLHALTTLEDSKNLENNSLNLAKIYLAAGINPDKSTLFIQSQIPEHSELANIFNMITPLSMVELNPVYKEMREEHPNQNNLGLLAYPVLQAADILLYQTTHVPVGKDQEPHIEFAREIARKFNSRFGEIFIEPKTILQKTSKIFSLQNPAKKMSKSHGEKSYISLIDSPEEIRNKIKIAVTDSGKEIKYDEKNKPAISNLINIYCLFSEESVKKVEEKYKNKGYAEFKNDLAKIIADGLEKFRENYKKLEKNQEYVKNVLEKGKKEAEKIASIILKEAKKKIGLL